MQNIHRLLLIALLSSTMIARVGAEPPTSAPATSQPAQPPPRLGIVLMDANHYADAANRIRGFGGNLIVNFVKRGSRAEKMGLRQADVIKRINGKDMSTVDDVLDAVKTGQALKIEILRKRKPLVVSEIPELTHRTPDSAKGLREDRTHRPYTTHSAARVVT